MQVALRRKTLRLGWLKLVQIPTGDSNFGGPHARGTEERKHFERN
jgi:hypothetical protein